MKDNILRGKILDLLKRVYPDGIEKKTFFSILFQYHKPDEIRASLEYLIDTGFISLNELPHPVFEQEKVQWYKLSPTGVNLLEGNIKEDPGILIQRG